MDAIGAASEYRAEIIAIPTERLDDDFFRLRTGVAGQVIQKFVTYRLRLVILGDISKNVQERSAFRDFVYECNSGSHIWFVACPGELNLRSRAERSMQ